MYPGTCEEIEIMPVAESRALAEKEIQLMEIPLPTGEKVIVRQRRPHRPLPLWLRIIVLLVGWVVLLVGVAGLVLPGIQGVVTILVGAAILSVASELAHRWMRKGLQRWPKVWKRVDGFRDKIYDRLHRMVNRD